MANHQKTSRMQSNHRNRKKKQRIILCILIPLFSVALFAAVYIAHLFATVENEIDASYVEIDRPEPVEEVNPIDQPVSFLFLGIDNDEDRQLGSTRADSIIYATLNPHTHEMNMLSIPRDTYVPIMRNGSVVRWDRINAAYAVGEESVMVQTIEEWLDVPVHYYATFNFNAFLEIIDELGGIEMEVPVTITEMNSNDESGAIYLEEGIQNLDGEQALALARTRKLDDDVARGHRQQMIIEAIIQKALGFQSVPKYTAMAETVGSNMRTNMRLRDMSAVAQTGLNQSFTIESHVFEWTSFMERDMDLVRIIPDSFTTIQSALQNSLTQTETNNSSRYTEETNDSNTSSSSYNSEEASNSTDSVD
ncbi:LCP family protein [Alkalibacterium olivapovliticus]|uniref:LCP family protein required for cell wall assembly n=1 Tax=Alkalibacterium olivapovliticus TaxID=99907 RepID=A0A2T0W9V9_9LACT|nr:LCP family protein [Alkalibacterium olivapovliticus]PRY83483.1 LCP family protein required for cell wall assembly [Alkalibacterium olivapovliticus]